MKTIRQFLFVVLCTGLFAAPSSGHTIFQTSGGEVIFLGTSTSEYVHVWPTLVEGELRFTVFLLPNTEVHYYFSNVTGIYADMGGGSADQFNLHHLELDGNLEVYMSDTSDSRMDILDSIVHGSVIYDGQTGTDRVKFIDSIIGGGVDIRTRRGYDTVIVRNSSLLGGMEARTGNGEGQFEFNQSNFYGLRVFGGSSTDDVYMSDCTIDSKASVELRGGHDDLLILNSVFGGSPAFSGGTGYDTGNGGGIQSATPPEIDSFETGNFQ